MLERDSFVLRIDPALSRGLNTQALRSYILVRDTLAPGDRGPFSGPFQREEALAVLEQRNPPDIAERVFNNFVERGLIVQQRRSREDMLADEIFGRFS